jgi:hypothetical protein
VTISIIELRLDFVDENPTAESPVQHSSSEYLQDLVTMKFSLLPLAFLTTLVAAQDLGSLDVSDLYVDKHEDPLTLQIKVHYVSFTINGTNADNIHCEATTPRTFPMTDPVKCDGDTSWHFILGTGSEGSGIQFDVTFYYQGTGVT